MFGCSHLFNNKARSNLKKDIRVSFDKNEIKMLSKLFKKD